MGRRRRTQLAILARRHAPRTIGFCNVGAAERNTRAESRLFSLAVRLHVANGVQSRIHGFTLIEVMVATGLLVTIALGTAQMFALAIDHTLSSRHQLLMTIVAERKIDELAAAVARGVVAIGPSGTLDGDVDGFVDRPADAGGVYVRRWRVLPVPGYETEALAIVVRVLPPARTVDVWMTAIVPRGPL